MAVLRRHNFFMDSTHLGQLRSRVGDREVSRTLRHAVRILAAGPIIGTADVIRILSECCDQHPPSSSAYLALTHAIARVMDWTGETDAVA